MARDSFDESKTKKKKTTKAATKPKSQSSSVSKPKATKVTSSVNKTTSKSTFLGGGASTQKVKKAVTNNKPKTVKKQPTQQERINQKTYGTTTAPTRRTKTATSNTQRNVETKVRQTVEQARRTRTEAQQQKLTGGVDVARARRQTQEIGREIKSSLKNSFSDENRAFAQRQKSGILTAEDKKKVEQRDQRRAQIAKNTGAVAWKAAQDTVSGYGQSLADVDEMVKSNKNWTKAKAQKMGIDLNDKAKVSKVEQERQQSIKEAREFRQELFNKQEKRQAEWDERTKNAKGLEKAWYGAVESGTGMLADTAVGAVTGTGQFGALASMGLRTYGSSANQARKEGATDKEARLYGLAQSAKEVGTELMFQGAGLAKAAYGKTGLSLADKSANVLTRGLTGIKADAVGAGVRALGGTAEENVEELAGWMADPLIKELTYGKAVRNRMKENLRSNIPQIGSGADAANVASYFSTPKFTDDLTKEYIKSGMSKDKASALAAEMRDYYVAYYSGDKGKTDALEEDLAAKLSGQDKLSFKSWSMDELKDTLASTTLLTLATGLPGAVTTSAKGNQIFDSDEVKAVFGNDAVKKVADAVKNTSNKEMSLKADVMKQRLDSGKDLTGTQKFDLYQGYIEKVNETSKKARASYGVVENAREEQDLVPTMGVDRAGNTVYAKETQREYDEKYASTAVTAESLRRFMESDNSISDDEIRRTDAAIKAVSDLHVGGLTIGDAHEFAYGNTLARETLKAEEGIDLDRYIVRDANGNVDLAATNEATENALFKINADNAIKAAQAETEVYIDDTRGNIDKDLLTRFGNSGQAAWKEVNKDLDPRDLKNYLTTANAASYFYSAGRNTDMSVAEAINRYADTFKTVDNSVLEKAFAAGAEDRIIANTPGYGQTVEAGSNIQLKKTEPIITGQLIMDDDVVIPDSDQSAYLALAMSTNSNIHIVGNLNAMGKDGKPIINQATGLPVQLNGMSHGNEIYLNMNASAEQNLGYVFMHEMTHQIKQYAPNEYLALENLVRDKWFNKDAVGMQAAIKQRMDLYSTKGGQQLTEEKAVEEIIADAMAEAMDDPNFAAEVCEQDINLGQQILDSIRAALRSIRQIFANSDVKNDRFHNSLLSYLGILDEAEKMWIDALHTARQNKADGLIADWQDKANKQNAPRLSVASDADYMKAVESGNMKAAQKMVDEAAEAAGYTFGKVYHGTPDNDFTVFHDGIIFFTSNRDTADEYRNPGTMWMTHYDKGRTLGAYIKLDNPLKLDNSYSDYRNEHTPWQEWKPTVYGRVPDNAMSATDVAKRAQEEGYDGVFIANDKDTKWTDSSQYLRKRGRGDTVIAFKSNQVKSADPVTYDDNGNVIPLSERFNTESPDIRFSLSEPVERVADLIAVHNLKPDDIRNTFELGGFPMPSIAITKDSMGHDLYGDITLMFHSDTIDPNFFRSNQVFGGDAWTPTFPTIAKKVSRKVADKVDKKLKDILGLGQYDYTLGDLRLPSLDDDNLTNALRYNEPYEAFKNDEVFQIAYLKNAKNFDVAVPTKEGRIRSFDKQALEYLDDNLPELTYNDIYDTVDHTMQYEPAVRKARKDYYENKGGAKLKALANRLDEEMGYSDVISRLEALIKFREEGIPEVTDRDALKSILDENVDQEGYKAWIDNLFEGIIEKTGIRNDKDMFTPSGNRRSWESLHDPVTLENVVKVMKTELAAGGTGLFGSNPKGAAQKQYKSLDEIRADEGRLQNLSEEEYKAKSEEAVGKMSEVCIAIAEHNPKRFSNSFGAALDVGSDIAEILNSTRNRDTIQRKLKKDYWLDVTDEQMDDLMEAIDAIANLPTGYFEAKPRRAVGFDEVRAAVIPANTDADIKEGFSKRGITTYEYDPEVEGDRTAKVNDAASEQDLRFSISENNSRESLTEWQQEYFRNSKIVDEDGRLKIMYHGTPNMGFTVFDLKKAKPGTLGRGFYFTDSKTHAGNHGQQMEVYLNIENPLQPDTYDITKEQLRQFVAALAEDEDYGIDNYGYDATVDSVTDSVWGRSDFQMLHDLNLTCVGDLAEACRLFNYVNGTNYDGIVTAVETLAMRPEQIKLTDNLAPTSDPDIRFSVSDDEYLSAVEKYQQMYDANEWGWLQAEDEIQRMVDQAAVEAGYATKAYHGTDAEFNVFKREYIAHGRLYGDGFYFSPLEEIAGSYGSNVKPYFLKTGVLTERELMSDYLAAQDYKDFADKDDAIAFSREKRQQFEKYGQGIERFRPDVDIVQGMYRVIYTTVGAFQNGYIMVATEPEYIKSAEPIVKDDNGNVIPLSKRFNDNSVDTRFSISATDSQGNRLTEEQRQYFGNSQARDRDGKLAVVYHTTNAGGFTVFDPEYSDDKRSLFFTSNFDMSQSYGTNAFRNLMREGTENISFDDFIKMDGPSISTVVATRLIDLLDPETGEVLWDGTENPVGTGSTLKYWYKKDNSKYLVSVGGEVMDREGFDRWMNEQAEDILYGYKNHGYYECYLNLEDPLIIECNGSNWDSIKEPDFESLFLSYDGEDFYIDGTTVPFSLEDIRDLYGVGFAERAEEWIETADPTDLEMGDTLYTWHGGPYDPEVEGHWPTEEDTRYWCNEAETLGYDGVIFRDLKDNGPYGKFKETGDVYVAFSSNQVKDTRNENPTENPDIRYSIVDDDEAMSHMAHDYAYDTSYEALAYYEDLIDADASTETTYEKAKNYIAKDVDEFYAGLTRYADGMKFDDPVLEEGRTRMARSKQDYFNSNVAKWNDAWLTDGEVLDPKSIKKPVKDLVTAVMSESNTNKKYKIDLVNKAIIDIRLAYFYAKKGRTDVADALLWHSAHRMIDGVEFYADDTSYEEYKGLRDYMKNTRIQLGEEYWSDVDFGAFRKENFGRMNLVKGETNVDKIYAELEDMYPGLFDSEEYDNAPDQLMHMASVLDSVQPYAEAYSSEYCAEWATDIASDLLNIMQNGKELQSIADRYTNKYEAKIKAMKARHAEAMLKVRQQRDEGINAQKAKFKEYKEQQKEKKAHNKSFESIQKTHKKLTERLLTNTADKNIPEQYKRDLARLLAAFDLQTVGSKKYEMRTGRQGQKTIKMAALKTALTNIENKSHEFHVSDAITDIIDELLGKNAGSGYSRSIEGLTIDELNSSELARIDKLLKALLHEFNTYRNVKIGAKRQQTEDIGKAQVDSALEHAKMFGAGKDYQNIPGGIDRIINLDEVTPAYMFKHIDPEKSGLGLMFKELRRSFDKYVKNQEQLNEWMNDIVGKYHKKSKLPWRKYGAGELENWRSENYSRTFNLENGTVRLTPAQMMSLYCLSKRTQAYNHMVGAGIVVAPVSFNAKIMSDLKKKPNTALPVKLTDADIKQIVTQLTPDQIKVADDLQQLMAERMAAWGNEASMNVLGIELFGEPDYFPIKSDKAALEKDLNENEFVEAIRNFGFTKAVQPGARNAIMVDDIFDVVTEHCNNMNLYNAYSEAINDFMKVYNYRDFRDDGSEYTVQQAIAHAYGSKATTFIMTFMRDLNGNVSGRASGIENLYNSMLGNAKKAAVFANLRVAAQQPTAITRAFAVIDPKYLKGIKIENGAMDELFEHCPIALWKSWGYYDINMGKSIEDIMMNNGRWLEDAATELYGALDNVTWTAIWQMVKAEMKDTHPDVKVGSDEYWELCNERMTEIVDLTQVVDSPFHRSHAMRDKGIFVKAATSFMAEPTLTFNMLRDGVIRSREAWKKGDKAEAAKIAVRIGAVALLQAATVAGAASLVDALRKKRPDKDDEDERFLHLWWVNALENFRDELKVWNKIYFVKDIASIFDGWDNSNLALQGIQKFALGYRQLTGDPYARSSAEWYENMIDGIGYMTGVPVKTVRTGLKNAMGMLGVSISALDSVGEKLDSVSLKKEDGETGMIGKLLGLVLSDDEDSLLDKYAEKKGYKKIEKSDDDVVSEKTSEGGETEEPEKREQLDYDTMLNKALKAAEGYEGEEYNQRIYSSVAQGMKGYIADGDYVSIGMMRTVIEQAGGDVNYFDQRVMEETKSAYKKSLKYDMSYEERWDQKAMYRYMMQHGMSQEELSSEVLYKSDLAKDMKVAYRIGDNDIIYEAMMPLVDAGMTQTDLDRLYENRNKMDIAKYKQNGRYKDKLKSMGTFIWPTDGVITSHFGYRNAPTAGASSNHPAIDIGAPQGTAVVAADGGVVISAGANGGYGNSVGIKHDNGMITWYNHLYDWNVKVGDTVAQGQQIAQVGSTGISTGPHLDFKIMDTNGKPVDPEKYLN